MTYVKKTLNKKAIGFKIWECMNVNKITFEELAFYLQLKSPRVIYEWVNGNKLPKLENFINLCFIFNVKFKDFIFFI